MNAHERADAFPPGAALRIALCYAALFTTFAVATPYLQVLLAAQGFDRDAIGLIQGALEMMAIAAPPLWGYLSDRLGRPRLVIAAAIVGSVCSFWLFGAARGLAAGLGVALLFGLFYRPLIPLTDGYVFRLIHLRGGDYGKVRWTGSVSFIAVILTLVWLGVDGPRSRSLILGGMTAAGAVYLLAVARLPADGSADAAGPTLPAPSRADLRALMSRGFLLFTLCAFLGRLAMTSYYHFFSLFLTQGLRLRNPTWLWTLGPLSEIPVLYFSGAIMRRIGVRNLFALGLLGAAVRLTCFSFVTELWQIVPLQFLHALTFGAYHAASVTFISRLAPPHMKATAQSAFAALSGGLGGLCGGALGGFVAQRWGFAALYRSFGLIAFAAVVLLLLFTPNDRRAPSA